MCHSATAGPRTGGAATPSGGDGGAESGAELRCRLAADGLPGGGGLPRPRPRCGRSLICRSGSSPQAARLLHGDANSSLGVRTSAGVAKASAPPQTGSGSGGWRGLAGELRGRGALAARFRPRTLCTQVQRLRGRCARWPRRYAPHCDAHCKASRRRVLRRALRSPRCRRWRRSRRCGCGTRRAAGARRQAASDEPQPADTQLTLRFCAQRARLCEPRPQPPRRQPRLGGAAPQARGRGRGRRGAGGFVDNAAGAAASFRGCAARSGRCGRLAHAARRHSCCVHTGASRSESISETIPQHAAQQRPLGAADASPSGPGQCTTRPALLATPDN